LTDFNLNSYVYYENKWNLLNIDDEKRVILNTYFAFTTLASVGFGDYYPVNTYEKGIFTIIFLFGCSIFSYFIG